MAIPLVEREPESLLECNEELGVKGVAGNDRVPDAAEIVMGVGGALNQRHALLDALAQDRDAEPSEEVEALLDVERPVVDHGLCTTRPRSEERIPDHQGRACVSRAPDEIAGARVKPMFCLHPGGPRGSMGQRGPLRRAGRPGRKENEGRVARERVEGRLHR